MNKFGLSDSVLDAASAVLNRTEYIPEILPEAMEMAKLIEDYILNEYFDKEHVGSSKNYHIHSTDPEAGRYQLTHKKTGKKLSINVSDNYPMNRTKDVKKNIKGKVPGSDTHGIAKKINSHLQSAPGTGDVRRSLRKDGVKRADMKEAEDYVLEAMEMYLKPHGTDGTKYKVHAVGKKLAAHGGIKVGEVLNDTEVDDAKESGIRVSHVKNFSKDPRNVKESIGGAIGKAVGGAVSTAGKAVGGTAKVAGKVAGGTMKATGKVAGGTMKTAGKVAGSVAGGTAAATKGAAKGVVGGAAAAGKGIASGLKDTGKGGAAGTVSTVKGTAQGGKELVKRTVAGIKEDEDIDEMYDDDGWHAHREMHGDKGISKEDWKKGIRLSRSGKRVNINDKKVAKEGAMKRMATQAQLGEPGSGLETFKKKMDSKKDVKPTQEPTKEDIDLVDQLLELNDAEFNEFLDESTDEQLDEIASAIGRAAMGTARIAGKGMMAAGRGAMKVGRMAAGRMSVQGRADAAERKTQKLQDKTKAVQDKMAARKKLAQQKAAGQLARQKLKAIKQQAKQQRADLKKPVTDNKAKYNWKAVPSSPLNKEEVEIEENRLGTNDSEKLNGGVSKDPRFRSPGSHIDYHHRQTGGHMKPGGDADEHRYQVAKKLGYIKEEVEIEESVGLSTNVMSFLDDYEGIMEKKLSSKEKMKRGLYNEYDPEEEVVDEGKVEATKGYFDRMKLVNKGLAYARPKRSGPPTGGAQAFKDRMSKKKKVDEDLEERNLTMKAPKIDFKQGLRGKGKLDPVGKADADIDNDGDVDSSDSYLHNRREAIKKAMKKSASMKEAMNDKEEAPFEGGKPIPKKRMDKFGNVIKDKNAAKHLAKMAMQKQTAKEDYDPLLEGAGDEEPNSAGNAASLAAHYQEKAKKAAESGNSEVAAKMARIAKKFYNKSGHMAKRERAGRGSKAESFEPEIFWSDAQIEWFELVEDENPANVQHMCMKQVAHEQYGEGECVHGEHADPVDGEVAWYSVQFEHGIEIVDSNDLEVISEKNHGHMKKKMKEDYTPEQQEAIEEIEEARKGGGAKVGETERSGHRVTKSSKEEPEHIAMQLRKVISVGKNHEGVHFDSGKEKVHPNVAQAALSRYNKAKPAEKEEMQKHMKHSPKGLAHVAGGHDLSKGPAADKKKSAVDVTQFSRHGVASKSGHYN